MTEKDQIVLSIVVSVLGEHRRTSEDNAQKYFNCRSKKCMHDRDKFNLSYNADSKIFRCWKCEVRGSVHTLTRMFGGTNDVEKLKLILPYIEPRVSLFAKPKIDYDSLVCDLPSEYKPLVVPQDSFKYRNALDYVMNVRKVSMEQIDKYNIGYTEDGPKKLRIIIPSYNVRGNVNYFEARAYFDKLNQTYMKPDFPDKDDIIFNEKFINWDLPIFLVEGVFDALRLPNAIPILGKHVPSYLVAKLMKYKPRIILCLDEDAVTKAEEIYNTLSSLGFDVYFIDMTGKGDVSKIYEDQGVNGIKCLLSSIRKLTFEFFIAKKLKL